MAEERDKKRDKHRYVRLSFDGSSCICEPREATAMQEEDARLEASEVWLTRAEFEALPDFAGF